MTRHKQSSLLEPRLKRTLYGATALLWLTGAVWLYAQESLLLKIHGAAAMIFLMVFGALFIKHIPAGLQQNKERPSGGFLLGACGVLVLTGWGLYYFGNDDLRLWTSRLHWLLGLALPFLIGFHVWLGKRMA